MRKYIFITLLTLILGGEKLVYSQDENDVVRYLDTDFSGTPRVASMAGAFGALGGDLSTPLINPAGIGILRKNDVVMTLGVSFNQTNTSVFNTEQSESEGKFIFSNIAFVTSGARKSRKKFYFNFSFGYFRTKDYNFLSNVNYLNSESSRLFDFTQRAYGVPTDQLPIDSPFNSNLAWETFLIDENDSTPVPSYLTQPRYEDFFPGVDQQYTIDESGSLGQFYFNGTFSYNEHLYFGLTLSILSGNFEQQSTFIETTTDDALLLDWFVYKYNQKSDINGANFKLGAIYKFDSGPRIGLAYHVSNKPRVTDIFSTSIRSQFKDGEFFFEESPEGRIDYKLKQPGKWVLSAAYVSGFKGLISFDFEWTNFSKSKIISKEFDFSVENQRINDLLKNTFTARIGGELWFGKFSLRAGYAYRQNPYKSVTPDIPSFFNTYSIGFGFLSPKLFYLNLSGSYKDAYRNVTAYSDNIAPIEHIDISIVEVLISGGYRF